MKAKFVNEELGRKKNIPEFTMGWEIIEYFDDIPEFNPYRNKEAQYDDDYYNIPAPIFSKVLGWTPEEVNSINKELENYEGGIYWETEEPESYEVEGPIENYKSIPFDQQIISVYGGA